MRLGQKQELFAHLYAMLILHAVALGFKVRLGEVMRTKEQAALYAEQGKGIKNSNHIKLLAGDLNLMKNGVYQTKTSQYRELGEWWEKQHPLCRWGGRFNDGCHFSLEHNGVK
jgi:hypothetical protein